MKPMMHYAKLVFSYVITSVNLCYKTLKGVLS